MIKCTNFQKLRPKILLQGLTWFAPARVNFMSSLAASAYVRNCVRMFLIKGRTIFPIVAILVCNLTRKLIRRTRFLTQGTVLHHNRVETSQNQTWPEKNNVIYSITV